METIVTAGCGGTPHPSRLYCLWRATFPSRGRLSVLRFQLSAFNFTLKRNPSSVICFANATFPQGKADCLGEMRRNILHFALCIVH